MCTLQNQLKKENVRLLLPAFSTLESHFSEKGSQRKLVSALFNETFAKLTYMYLEEHRFFNLQLISRPQMFSWAKWLFWHVNKVIYKHDSFFYALHAMLLHLWSRTCASWWSVCSLLYENLWKTLKQPVNVLSYRTALWKKNLWILHWLNFVSRKSQNSDHVKKNRAKYDCFLFTFLTGFDPVKKCPAHRFQNFTPCVKTYMNS